MSGSPVRILIASASAGTGHAAAAEAIRLALLETEPMARVEHVDVLRLGPQWLRTAYGDGFEFMASRAPRVWKELYQRTDGMVDSARWGSVAHRLLFPPFRHRLLTGGWDVVLCTHFLPGQLAAGRPGMPPFIMVPTDLVLHRYWAQRRVHRFFTGTEAMAAEIQRRLPSAHAVATGIPVRPSFATPQDRAAARRAVGLGGSGSVALVMGGGLGVGIAATARAVAAAAAPTLRVMVVTGSNQRARDELAPLAAADPRVRVLGRVDNVHQLMAASDFVVTKPGGLTTSEALAVGRPMVLTRAIPGQEEGNADTLCLAGAAVYAPGDAQVGEWVARFMAEPGLLERTSAAARGMGRPRAAFDVAERVLHGFRPWRVA